MSSLPKAFPTASVRIRSRSTHHGHIVPGRSLHSGFLTGVHGLALIGVLPAAVLWIPIARSSNFGNFTVLDSLLLLLWITTGIRLLATPRWSRSESTAVRIGVYAFAIGVFGCLAALLYGSYSGLTSQLLQQSKRFGFPAILPLAMLVSRTKDLPRMRVAGIVALVFTVASSYISMAESLPISGLKEQGVRASGSLGNANELGYIAVLGALLGLSHAAGSLRRGLGRGCLAATAVGAGLIGLTTSASRSALAAALIATVYIASKRRLTFAKKLSITIILIGSVIVGWQISSTYQGRMAKVLEDKTQERSTVARIEMQEVAFKTWVHYPLGIGFHNWEAATAEFSQDVQWAARMSGSDSIYFDFLLSSGVIGFFCLILCFRNCWMLGRFQPSPMEMVYLRAGMLAAFSMGLAAVCPASVCVAPFFFAVVGFGGCVRQDGLCKDTSWAGTVRAPVAPPDPGRAMNRCS